MFLYDSKLSESPEEKPTEEAMDTEEKKDEPKVREAFSLHSSNERKQVLRVAKGDQRVNIIMHI